MPSFAKHSPCFALPCVSTANQFLSCSKNMVSRIKIVCCALCIRSALEYISTTIETSSFAKQKHSSAKHSPSFAPQIFYRETISGALASALLSLMAFHTCLNWVGELVSVSCEYHGEIWLYYNGGHIWFYQDFHQLLYSMWPSDT